MIAKLLGAGFGLRGLLIGAGIAVVIGFGGGWKVRDAFCDAAAAQVQLRTANARIQALQENQRRILAAQTHDTKLAQAQAAELEQLQERHRELVAEISDGACFTPADLDRLRRGWNTGAVPPRSGTP